MRPNKQNKPTMRFNPALLAEPSNDSAQTQWAEPQSPQPHDPPPPGPEETALIGLLIDAIVGVGFPTLASGIEAEQYGLAVPTGRRDSGPFWVWSREELAKRCTLEQLQTLYSNLKQA